MSSETNDELSKETVFQIMGSYYGNAHYRAAQRLRWTTHDLVLTKQILDEINALGYHFSNLGRLSDHEDPRFIPIIFGNYGNFRIEASMRS